jgi:Glycosyl hydrolase family 63 C-terminal domain
MELNAESSWEKWGPYLTDRQWGTVREDYSADGAAWESVTHDMARSKAYRWGEEGIAGISDDKQLLCFAIAFWNKKDPILKERYFGLTGNEGNHGEDVKEYYYYLDNTPRHDYMKMLYKYPQHEFPYRQLVDENRRRSKTDTEYELIDTGVFDSDAYFDVFVEYAKKKKEDILVRISVHNRGREDASLNVLPTVWFRNTWSWGKDTYKPSLELSGSSVRLYHKDLGEYFLSCKDEPELLFTENETNNRRLYHADGPGRYFKDGINNYVVSRETDAVSGEHKGTKAAANYDITVKAGQSHSICVRLHRNENQHPFADFETVFASCKQSADDFYAAIQSGNPSEDACLVQRQAYAGLLWGKQFYYFNIREWLAGDPASPPPPDQRLRGRNHEWRHLHNADIISMPDKWEYPWYAAWDLAFHAVAFIPVDPAFAKKQLLLLTKEWYMHPNGQLPAYEWAFSDVNPPVHAWAAWRVYRSEQRFHKTKPDREFLESIFHKLLLNFNWWVNRKDANNNNLFEGGFLGLDNIGAFDRNFKMPAGVTMAQSDGTSWMAMFSLNMMRMALELAKENKVYQAMATKFFEHFLYIAEAMWHSGANKESLWDEDDHFYYDMLYTDDGRSMKLKVRSLVGLIPMFAVEILEDDVFLEQTEFVERLNWFLDNRPDLASLVSRWNEKSTGAKHLLSLLRGERLTKILIRMLDESEFLSDFGIRGLSKSYEKHPFQIFLHGETHTVDYVPGEGNSTMFGGNSNWRGPIWMPVNYLILESLRRFHQYYGDDFKVEYPSHSGKFLTLFEVVKELARRMTLIFLRDKNGRRPVFGDHEKFQTDPHFRDYILFYEYFHGDNGRGVGASHQTGWTVLIARLLFPLEIEDKWIKMN